MIEFDPILIHDWLSRSAQRYPNKTALIVGPERWTYADLDRITSRLAENFYHLGLHHQDRVVIFLENSSESVISLYGTLKAGGVVVILSGSMKSHKLKYILDNSGASFLVTEASKQKVVTEALSMMNDVPQVIWAHTSNRVPEDLKPISTCWHEVTSTHSSIEDGGKSMCVGGITIDVDLAALIYTSGSTGEPKGVMCTHHNMVSSARSIIQYIGNQMDDIVLNVLPLSFDYGLYQVIMTFMFGGTIVLEKSFLYPHLTLKLIEAEQITGFPIVPTIVAMLIRMQDLHGYDLRCLRYLTNTGATLPIEHIQFLRQGLPDVRIISMFGLTECKRVCYLQPEELDQRPGSVGKAMPNCSTAVVDASGNELGPHEIGELVIRGANVMQGYWRDLKQTEQAYQQGAYPAERFLHSGDLFKQDEEGYLYYLGRKDDMIKCKGERVSAKEVENCIYTFEEVSEVAVVGIPDAILGQAIKAFVVTRDEQVLTERRVLRHCSRQLETYMVPKYVEFVAGLPKTANGKIDKKHLKNREEEKHEVMGSNA